MKIFLPDHNPPPITKSIFMTDYRKTIYNRSFVIRDMVVVWEI